MRRVAGEKRRVVPASWKPELFVLDVDGVMQTGQFLYSKQGKQYKVFGADDHDALVLLQPFIEVRFVTGDRRGLPISRKRIVEDMKMRLDLVSTFKRVEWVRGVCDPRDAIYMGDGILDAYVFGQVGYGICPANGSYLARECADYVTQAGGGNRAVAEACLHLLDRFFTPFDPAQPPDQFVAAARPRSGRRHSTTKA